MTFFTRPAAMAAILISITPLMASFDHPEGGAPASPTRRAGVMQQASPVLDLGSRVAAPDEGPGGRLESYTQSINETQKELESVIADYQQAEETLKRKKEYLYKDLEKKEVTLKRLLLEQEQKAAKYDETKQQLRALNENLEQCFARREQATTEKAQKAGDREIKKLEKEISTKNAQSQEQQRSVENAVRKYNDALAEYKKSEQEVLLTISALIPHLEMWGEKMKRAREKLTSVGQALKEHQDQRISVQEAVHICCLKGAETLLNAQTAEQLSGVVREAEKDPLFLSFIRKELHLPALMWEAQYLGPLMIAGALAREGVFLTPLERDILKTKLLHEDYTGSCVTAMRCLGTCEGRAGEVGRLISRAYDLLIRKTQEPV